MEEIAALGGKVTYNQDASTTYQPHTRNQKRTFPRENPKRA